MSDATAELQARLQMAEQLAYSDPMTRLANQHLLDHWLKQEFPLAQQQQKDLVLMVVDLDHFALVNDRVGYDWGDHLLREIATDLRRQLPDEVLVGRRGDDEFVLMLSAPGARERLNELVEQVWSILTREREAANQKLHLRASIGTTLAPGFAQSMDELKKEADAALAFAKESGRGRTQLYDRKLRDFREDSRRQQAHLYDACVNQAVPILYQPIVSLEDGRLEGVEMSLVWDGGREPRNFLELIYKCNLGTFLGDWLLSQACAAAQQLKGTYYFVVPLLPGQLRDGDCCKRLMELVTRTKVNPARICLMDLEIHKEPRRNALIDNLAHWGAGIVYTDVAELLDTAERWPHRQHRFLRISEEWASQAPFQEPGARISVGLIRLANVANTRSYTAGVNNYEQAEFFSLGDCKAACGPYFGRFYALDEINTRGRWKVRS